ncbi:uncharacterized protein BDW43DRAFT_308434 [Aspergillus alliaceus]|uniref:uncharacterized protein n=1 Tax=Petromyces alliaceus TaxID=209559 RepID=UPI0012A601D6|nr:uncharacterized protein BDW43DRAFT_308434 [Aspergillus alliaceus]KAB8236167.1 hypothetical protein BDW43DRAFT_308434 [Aspergillus alliaceus]
MQPSHFDCKRLDGLLSRLKVDEGDFGYMSCAVYDTAWVSMVAKPTDNGKVWLFPECFRFVLDTQQADGSWPTYSAPVDGILNTAASLLSIKAHQANSYQLKEYSFALLEERVTKGAVALGKLLQAWDVENCDHVGFEILVPRMLFLLEEEGFRFDFPGKSALTKLNKLKLARFDPAYLYAPVKLTAVHSLEAFIGQIDFDRVRHHKTNGGYMGSPSSTAACLMYASTWDEESEDFLRWVFKAGSGQGSGGMPSAFPSTYFELTWVLTTLLEGGFTVNDIGKDRADRFASFLRRAIDAQSGRLGFASGMEVDVDDTAKSLLTLSLLGHPASHDGLLKTFEGETHFRTYKNERNPSLSANCNTLVALLHQPDVGALTPQIMKAASFISRAWWDGNLQDKWNTSEFYPMTLIAEAFGSLLRVWDRGDLPALPVTFITDSVLITLYQIVASIVMCQNANGSWGPEHSNEVTAYAMLALWKASIVPGASELTQQIQRALINGRKHILATTLCADSATEAAYHWIEKVSYRSVALLESYVLAALNLSSQDRPLPELSKRGQELSPVRPVDAHQLSLDCFDAPLFGPADAWKLQAAYIESRLFAPYLRRIANEIVPGMIENDPALEIIPFIYTACNYASRQPCHTFVLRQQIGALLIQSLLERSACQAAFRVSMAEIQNQTMQALTRAKSKGLMTPATRSNQQVV